MPKRQRPDRPGMWAAITSAVAGGWGQTARFIMILALLGTIAIVLAALSGHSVTAGIALPLNLIRWMISSV